MQKSYTRSIIAIGESLIAERKEYRDNGGGVGVSLCSPFRRNPRWAVYIVSGRVYGLDVLRSGIHVGSP